jgi:hypothetical protein
MMTSHWFTLRALKWVAAITITCVTSMAATRVDAQDILPPLFVSPGLAGPGVERTIIINIFAGCDFTAKIVGGNVTPKRTFVVRLDLPNAIFCDALTRRSASVRYTPESEGELRVHVVTDNGVYVGETVIKTRAANSNRSQVDLTGSWYDPASYGSGLTFIHGATREDTLFGTWYVYDSLGAPRWYTIQNVVWKSGGLEAEGQILETSANSVVCLPPLVGCPVAFASIAPLTRANITIQSTNTARIQAITANGQVLFTSNLIRAVF